MRFVLALAVCLTVLLSGARAQGDGPHVFEVDELNPGLPAPERAVNLETPQSSLETFMLAGEVGEWSRAAQVLDLSFLPAEQQALQGPVLAQQLYTLIDRTLLLDWAGVSDRPDALDVTATDQDPFAGAPRRSIRLGLLSTGERTAAVRLARLKAGEDDPVWVFPQQTVQDIPALYARHGPSAFERALPSFLRLQAFWTLAWWEVFALPLLALAAALLAALTWRVIGKMKRTGPLEKIGGVLGAIQLPSALLVFAAAFGIAQSFAFTFSGAVNTVLQPLIIALIVIAIGALVVEAIDAIIDRVANSGDEDMSQPDAEADRTFYTTLSAVRRFVLVIMLVGGIALVLIQSNLTQTLGFSLLASAGAIGIVLAFAARQSLANIMASLQIAFAKTARIGDAVLFDDDWSYVEKIGFTHVRLRTWDGRRIMAPVTEFVSRTFQNWTKTDPSMSKYVILILDHRADVGLLREYFERFVEHDSDIINKDDAKVQVIGHSRDGMEVRFLFDGPDPSTAWDIHCRLREEMLRVAADLDNAASVTSGPAFLPREREVKLGAAE